MINVYGMQEGQDGEEGKQKVRESWGRLKKELLLIEARGEAALVIGDLNRAMGTGELGVPGNKERVSYGGKMVRELLREGEYVLLNGLELAVGGPWTRVDQATGGLSCNDISKARKDSRVHLRPSSTVGGLQDASGGRHPGRPQHV